MDFFQLQSQKAFDNNLFIKNYLAWSLKIYSS